MDFVTSSGAQYSPEVALTPLGFLLAAGFVAFDVFFAAENSYASSSQSVIGGSTSSRCVMRMKLATFDFDASSTRLTCGAFRARPRNTTTSRNFFFGRTKK